MVAKAVLVLCASALLVKATFAACLGAAPALSWSGYGCDAAYSGNIMPACGAYSSGGAFGVTSSSPISPSGLFVMSENEIKGILNAAGELPVLATVALESTLPTSGSAGTSYSCGNGEVGISSNTLSAAGLNAGYGTGYVDGYGANIAAANLAANAGAFGAWNGARLGGCGCY